jgi:predicted N-acetyltransferase YhbS
MLKGGNLTVTAWDGDLLVGISRSITDFHYACYLSDLAVDIAYQNKGIGRKLIALTQDKLGPLCNLILLSAPSAAEYYPRVGFSKHPSAWILNRKDSIIGG